MQWNNSGNDDNLIFNYDDPNTEWEWQKGFDVKGLVTSEATNTEITTEGDDALITKDYFDTFGGGGGDVHPIDDATAIVKGSGDGTKLVRVEADEISTSTTRVITMPDKDVDLGYVQNARNNYALDINDSDVVVGTGWTDGTDIYTASTATGTLRANLFTATTSVYHTIIVSVSSYTSGTLRVKVGNVYASNSNHITAAGNYRYTILSTAQDDLFELVPITNFTGVVSRIEMVEGGFIDDYSNYLPEGIDVVGGSLTVGLGSGNPTFSLDYGQAGSTSGFTADGAEMRVEYEDTPSFSWDDTEARIELQLNMQSKPIVNSIVNRITNGGTAFNIASTDYGTVIYCTSSSAVTITIVDTLSPVDGETFTIIQQGTGVVTIKSHVSDTTTINGSDSLDIIVDGQWGAVQFIHMGSNTDDWHAFGKIQ